MTDSTSHDHHPSQSQGTDEHTLEGYYDGLNSYAAFPEQTNSGNEFIWHTAEPTVFASTPSYTPPVATHTQAWNPNAVSQVRDPNLTAYGGLQSSFQVGQYGRPFYPSHPSPQLGHDPHLIPRHSPSPAQHNGQAHAAALAQRNQFQQQHPLSQQSLGHSPYHSGPGYDVNANQNYLSYGHHPSQAHLQGINPDKLNWYADQPQQRPAASSIDPVFLTASNAQQPTTVSSAGTQHFPGHGYNSPAPTGHHQQSHPSTTSAQARAVPAGNSAFTGVIIPHSSDKPAAKVRKIKDPNAPKRPRGRPRKDGTMPRVKAEMTTLTSESDSDELLIEKEEPVPDFARGLALAPAEEQIVREVGRAVWAPVSKPVVVEKIQQGIASFGDIVKKQRDAWKVKNEALKQAELANNPIASRLKQEVAQFRNMIEILAIQAIKFGHPAHLAKLGENPFTMSALQAFLVDRINVMDMDGSLVTNILRLMTKFTTLDDEMLEKTKTSKILTRLTKKAGGEVKKLAQTVLDQAILATKRKVLKPGTRDSPVPTSYQKTVVAAGLKRPREADGPNMPATKRAVMPTAVKQASKPLALQNAERKKLESTGTKAKTLASLSNGIMNAAPSMTSKPIVAAAASSRPTPSPFSGLMSASKKPGTSNAARAAAAAAAKEKTASSSSAVMPKRASPPRSIVDKVDANIAPVAKSTFSFMDALADMSRPKQSEEKKIDDRPPETEEERKKRLRKEERRKLRVSWAPESELTQIKLFEHDPEEEINPADSAMRDVSDIGGEGRMLKLHKELDDFDDEDDSRFVDDFAPYNLASEVDFSVLDEDSQNNYFSRGGAGKPESPEKEAQDAREVNTLMVVYAVPSDIPPTPKEPPADDEDYVPLTEFGQPSELVRDRESRFYEAQHIPQQTTQATNMTPDLSALIAAVRNQTPAAQQPTFNTFTPHSQPLQHVAEGSNINNILAVMSQFQAMQPQQQQPPPQAPVQQPQQPGNQINLAAILAQMQGQQAAAPLQSQSQAFLNANPNASPNPYPGPDSEYSRRHNRGGSADYDEQTGGSGQGGWKKKGGNGSGPKSHPKAKTVVCKFWQEGKCKKGDDCTFIHES